MKDVIERFDSEFQKFKSSPHAERADRYDRGIGRLIGFAKAVGWTFAAVLGGAAGYAIHLYSEGWIAIAATLVTATIIFYALWRAWRGLFHAPRASEIVLDEIGDRIEKADMALNVAKALHAQVSAASKNRNAPEL